MKSEFSGIERRLDELSERLARLEAIRDKPRSAFDDEPFLRDIAERNLEIVAQCCIDISQRIISLEDAQRPSDYQEAILRLGEIDVLPVQLSRRLAPIAGFRNILVHQYTGIDWDTVYKSMQDLSDLSEFGKLVRIYLADRQ